MKYNKLGKSDIEVSELCLGSMTWGEQNTEAEAHEQINYALERGINFIDTAELYAVPSSPETQGLTEKCIGSWIAKNQGKRKDIVIGSKVAGPSRNLNYMTDYTMGFNSVRINEAVENSLKRLNTDYIDLYHLHWPERGSNMFGQRDYNHNAEWQDNFESILNDLNTLKKEGKIRHYALSNETAWGVMNTSRVAERINVEGFTAIQNPYNLINRTYEINLSEVSLRENIPLLAYSPLGMGVLTGKYNKESVSEDARLKKFKNRFPRYSSETILPIADKYLALAKINQINITQMALAFVVSRPFVASAIIGATSLSQLKENIDSLNLKLSEELVAQINEIHNHSPNPAP